MEELEAKLVGWLLLQFSGRLHLRTADKFTAFLQRLVIVVEPAREYRLNALRLQILSHPGFILLRGSLKELGIHSVRIGHHVVTHVVPILIVCHCCDLFALLLQVNLGDRQLRVDDLWVFYLSNGRDELGFNVFFGHFWQDFHTFAD